MSLISIYKRLRAFEATLRDEPLDAIEAEPVRQSVVLVPGGAPGLRHDRS